MQSPTQLVTVSSTLASVAQVDSHLGSLATVFAQLRSIPGLQLAIDNPQQLLSLVTGGASTLFTYTLAYVWGGRDLRAVAPRSDSANFPGFFSILCSVFRDSVVTIFRVIS